MMDRRNIMIVFAGLLLILVPQVGESAEHADRSVQYVTVSFGSQSIGGEFGGQERVSSVKGFFAIPSVESGEAFGIGVGTRIGLLGAEMGYRQAEHAVRWGEERSEAVWRGIGLEARLYSPVFGPARGFLSAGVAMEWLSVEGGYCSDSTGLDCMSRFEGVGFTAGPGLVAQVHERVFVSGQAVYRRSEFDTVGAATESAGTLPYSVTGEGWVWLAGVGVTF